MWRTSLPGEHGDSLPLQVKVRLPAHVDGHPLDRSAGEPVGPLPRVVVGDRLAAVPADTQALARELECAGLGLYATLADLAVSVVEGQHAGGHARFSLALLLEGGGQDQVVPGGQVLGRVNVLLGDTDEVVDIAQ